MWAIITKEEKIIARDFRTRPAALEYLRFHCGGDLNNYIIINQNTNKFAMIELKRYKL